MSNLFGTAQKVAKPTKTKKDYEEVILLESEYPKIGGYLASLELARGVLEEYKGIETGLVGIIKDIAQKEYVKLYKRTGANPKTFIIRGGDEDEGGCFMIQPMDKYKTVDEAKKNYLIAEYGEEVIDQKEEYIFNSAVINKEGNMDKISKAIMASDLSEQDKESLITQKVSIAVAKGTIDNFSQLGDVENALFDFDPIFALKNYK